MRRLLNPQDYVSCDVVDTADGPACRCSDFIDAREEYVPASLVRGMANSARGKNAYDKFCAASANIGVDQQKLRSVLSKMIIRDVILASSDRHWRNLGFVRNVDSLAMRPAPLLDAGNCPWFAKSAREVAARDWTFAVRPFAFGVHAQLAFVDDVSWFDPVALEGFADEACDNLSASTWACADGRLDFIREGINRSVAFVADVAKVVESCITRMGWLAGRVFVAEKSSTANVGIISVPALRLRTFPFSLRARGLVQSGVSNCLREWSPRD